MCAHLVATRCSRACVRRCLPPCFPAVFRFEPNVGGPFVRKCRPTTQFALSHSLSQSLPPMLESRFFVAQTYSGRGVVIVHRGVSGPRLFLPSFLPSSLLELDDVLSSTHSQGEPSRTVSSNGSDTHYHGSADDGDDGDDGGRGRLPPPTARNGSGGSGSEAISRVRLSVCRSATRLFGT